MQALAIHVSPRSGRQRGQALVESLIAMLALAALWAALHWLAHYQDIALSAVHASRHAAFAASRTDPEEPGQGTAADFFSGSAHRWTDRHGGAVLDTQEQVQLSWQRLRPLSSRAQAGSGFAQVPVLRRDWSLEDSGILKARVAPRFAPGGGSPADGAGKGLKLQAFKLDYPPLTRSTSLLTGAGHATSDTAVQSRVESSGLAWAAAHSVSRLAGAEAQFGAGGVDAGWGRPGPGFDWLQAWSGRVPDHLITDYADLDHGGY